MTYQESSFDHSTVELDGHVFLRCIIQDCVLVYRGGPLPTLDGCAVTRCQFVFQDAALRTLTLLTSLHAGDFQEVVDHFIQTIRSGGTADLGRVQ